MSRRLAGMAAMSAMFAFAFVAPRVACAKRKFAPPPAPAPAETVAAPRGSVEGGKKAPARAQVAESIATPSPASGREVVQRESRIEFDERLVQGQTAAGAIYLFQRGESEFRSMIKLPESFRDRSVRQLLPEATRR